MDGDEFKVRCKYCNCMLNARYLQLLRHSLSNKHLCNAAAAAAVSFPMDVDSCVAPQASEDGQMMTDVEDEDGGHVLVAEPADVDDVQHFFTDSTSVSFITDTVTGHANGCKKVCKL